MPDPYAVLGLANGASPEDIRAAYRRLAFIAHPDRGGTTDALVKIREAHDAALALAAKEPCRECYGAGHIVHRGGLRSLKSTCKTCMGTGRRWP